MSVAVATAVGALVAFEPLMAAVHRFLFHGPLWCSHRSHHERPTARRLVSNDFLWVPYLALAAVLALAGAVWWQRVFGQILVGVGAGAAGYALAYILAHDGLAHGRFWMPAFLRRSALGRRLIRSHRRHHRGGTSGLGAAPFGIYGAPLEIALRIGDGFTPTARSCEPDRAPALV